MKFLKNNKNKIIFLFLIFCSILPFNFLRIFFYNLVPKIIIKKSYIGFLNIFINTNVTIKNSYIGNFNFINIKNFKIKNSSFKNFNFLNNFYKFYINKKSIIGSFNFFNNKNYKKTFLFCFKSQISNKIFIEMDTNVILRENVVFGGHGSKIINNQKNLKRTFFNRNIFVGSHTLIQSGTVVKGKNVTIGTCSVIDNNIKDSGKYFSKKINLLRRQNI